MKIKTTYTLEQLGTAGLHRFIAYLIIHCLWHL